MEEINKEFIYQRERSLLMLAIVMSIAAIIGFLCFVIVPSIFTKALLLLAAFCMVSNWFFYTLYNLVHTMDSEYHHLLNGAILSIFTIIGFYNPLDFHYMWVYLLYYPIIVALIEREGTYKVWSSLYLISYSFFILFHNQTLNHLSYENTTKSIFQILLAIGSVIIGYIMVKHVYFIRNAKKLEKDKEIKNHLFEVLSNLIPIVEMKSQTTRNEINQMSELMKHMSAKVPNLKVKDWEIELLSLLHFVSKAQWPDYLFEKSGKLTEYEYNLVQNHCQFGASLLGNFEVFQPIKEVFVKHHKRTDGTGYPNTIDESSIPLLAQALGIVESYLAMISPRSYRPAMTIEEAVTEILKQECSRVAPSILKAFTDTVNERYGAIPAPRTNRHFPKVI